MTNEEGGFDVYDFCVEVVGEEDSLSVSKELLQCVTERLQMRGGEDPLGFSTAYFTIFSACLIFFMQSGFAMLCAGSVREKNVGNTMLKNLLDACGAAVAFYSFGYAFAYGGMDPDSTVKTFIGSRNFFLMDFENHGFWLFQYAFSATSATIVAGALAERCQMTAYLCYSLLLVGWVYPVVVHAIWNPQGFLSAQAVDPLWGVGVIDFAGSGVVHTLGGLTALFATTILGPRKGRFHDDNGRPLESPQKFPGHSVALQMLGSFILWFGWYGFNAGSALILNNDFRGEIGALAAVNTALSGGVGGLSGLFLNLFIVERRTGEAVFDIQFAMFGLLSGLVGITAGCAVVETWAALVIGFVSGIIYIGGNTLLIRLRIDDAVDAIPVHLLNGMWGVVSVGLFASPSRLELVYGHSRHAGWFYSFTRGSSDATLLGTQLCGLLFIIGWVSTVMGPFFVWIDWMGWFRSDPLTELVGLDLSYHGGLVLNKREEVHPLYINAFNERRKSQLDQSRRRHTVGIPVETAEIPVETAETPVETAETPGGTPPITRDEFEPEMFKDADCDHSEKDAETW